MDTKCDWEGSGDALFEAFESLLEGGDSSSGIFGGQELQEQEFISSQKWSSEELLLNCQALLEDSDVVTATEENFYESDISDGFQRIKESENEMTKSSTAPIQKDFSPLTDIVPYDDNRNVEEALRMCQSKDFDPHFVYHSHEEPRMFASAPSFPFYSTSHHHHYTYCDVGSERVFCQDKIYLYDVSNRQKTPLSSLSHTSRSTSPTYSSLLPDFSPVHAICFPPSLSLLSDMSSGNTSCFPLSYLAFTNPHILMHTENQIPPWLMNSTRDQPVIYICHLDMPNTSRHDHLRVECHNVCPRIRPSYKPYGSCSDLMHNCHSPCIDACRGGSGKGRVGVESGGHSACVTEVNMMPTKGYCMRRDSVMSDDIIMSDISSGSSFLDLDIDFEGGNGISPSNSEDEGSFLSFKTCSLDESSDGICRWCSCASDVARDSTEGETGTDAGSDFSTGKLSPSSCEGLWQWNPSYHDCYPDGNECVQCDTRVKRDTWDTVLLSQVTGRLGGGRRGGADNQLCQVLLAEGGATGLRGEEACAYSSCSCSCSGSITTTSAFRWSELENVMSSVAPSRYLHLDFSTVPPTPPSGQDCPISPVDFKSCMISDLCGDKRRQKERARENNSTGEDGGSQVVGGVENRKDESATPNSVPLPRPSSVPAEPFHPQNQVSLCADERFPPKLELLSHDITLQDPIMSHAESAVTSSARKIMNVNESLRKNKVNKMKQHDKKRPVVSRRDEGDPWSDDFEAKQHLHVSQEAQILSSAALHEPQHKRKSKQNIPSYKRRHTSPLTPPSHCTDSKYAGSVQDFSVGKVAEKCESHKGYPDDICHSRTSQLSHNTNSDKNTVSNFCDDTSKVPKKKNKGYKKNVLPQVPHTVDLVHNNDAVSVNTSEICNSVVYSTSINNDSTSSHVVGSPFSLPYTSSILPPLSSLPLSFHMPMQCQALDVPPSRLTRVQGGSIRVALQQYHRQAPHRSPGTDVTKRHHSLTSIVERPDTFSHGKYNLQHNKYPSDSLQLDSMRLKKSKRYNSVEGVSYFDNGEWMGEGRGEGKGISGGEVDIARGMSVKGGDESKELGVATSVTDILHTSPSPPSLPKSKEGVVVRALPARVLNASDRHSLDIPIPRPFFNQYADPVPYKSFNNKGNTILKGEVQGKELGTKLCNVEKYTVKHSNTFSHESFSWRHYGGNECQVPKQKGEEVEEKKKLVKKKEEEEAGTVFDGGWWTSGSCGDGTVGEAHDIALCVGQVIGTVQVLVGKTVCQYPLYGTPEQCRYYGEKGQENWVLNMSSNSEENMSKDSVGEQPVTMSGNKSNMQMSASTPTSATLSSRPLSSHISRLQNSLYGFKIANNEQMKVRNLIPIFNNGKSSSARDICNSVTFRVKGDSSWQNSSSSRAKRNSDVCDMYMYRGAEGNEGGVGSGDFDVLECGGGSGGAIKLCGVSLGSRPSSPDPSSLFQFHTLPRKSSRLRLSSLPPSTQPILSPLAAKPNSLDFVSSLPSSPRLPQVLDNSPLTEIPEPFPSTTCGEAHFGTKTTLCGGNGCVLDGARGEENGTTTQHLFPTSQPLLTHSAPSPIPSSSPLPCASTLLLQPVQCGQHHEQMESIPLHTVLKTDSILPETDAKEYIEVNDEVHIESDESSVDKSTEIRLKPSVPREMFLDSGSHTLNDLMLTNTVETKHREKDQIKLVEKEVDSLDSMLPQSSYEEPLLENKALTIIESNPSLTQSSFDGAKELIVTEKGSSNASQKKSISNVFEKPLPTSNEGLMRTENATLNSKVHKPVPGEMNLSFCDRNSISKVNVKNDQSCMNENESRTGLEIVSANEKECNHKKSESLNVCQDINKLIIIEKDANVVGKISSGNSKICMEKQSCDRIAKENTGKFSECTQLSGESATVENKARQHISSTDVNSDVYSEKHLVKNKETPYNKPEDERTVKNPPDRINNDIVKMDLFLTNMGKRSSAISTVPVTTTEITKIAISADTLTPLTSTAKSGLTIAVSLAASTLPATSETSEETIASTAVPVTVASSFLAQTIAVTTSTASDLITTVTAATVAQPDATKTVTTITSSRLPTTVTAATVAQPDATKTVTTTTASRLLTTTVASSIATVTTSTPVAAISASATAVAAPPSSTTAITAAGPVTAVTTAAPVTTIIEAALETVLKSAPETVIKSAPVVTAETTASITAVTVAVSVMAVTLPTTARETSVAAQTATTVVKEASTVLVTDAKTAALTTSMLPPTAVQANTMKTTGSGYVTDDDNLTIANNSKVSEQNDITTVILLNYQANENDIKEMEKDNLFLKNATEEVIQVRDKDNVGSKVLNEPEENIESSTIKPKTTNNNESHGKDIAAKTGDASLVKRRIKSDNKNEEKSKSVYCDTMSDIIISKPRSREGSVNKEGGLISRAAGISERAALITKHQQIGTRRTRTTHFPLDIICNTKMQYQQTRQKVANFEAAAPSSPSSSSSHLTTSSASASSGGGMTRLRLSSLGQVEPIKGPWGSGAIRSKSASRIGSDLQDEGNTSDSKQEHWINSERYSKVEEKVSPLQCPPVAPLDATLTNKIKMTIDSCTRSQSPVQPLVNNQSQQECSGDITSHISSVVDYSKDTKENWDIEEKESHDLLPILVTTEIKCDDKNSLPLKDVHKADIVLNNASDAYVNKDQLIHELVAVTNEQENNDKINANLMVSGRDFGVATPSPSRHSSMPTQPTTTSISLPPLMSTATTLTKLECDPSRVVTGQLALPDLENFTEFKCTSNDHQRRLSLLSYEPKNILYIDEVESDADLSQQTPVTADSLANRSQSSDNDNLFDLPVDDEVVKSSRAPVSSGGDLINSNTSYITDGLLDFPVDDEIFKRDVNLKIEKSLKLDNQTLSEKSNKNKSNHPTETISVSYLKSNNCKETDTVKNPHQVLKRGDVEIGVKIPEQEEKEAESYTSKEICKEETKIITAPKLHIVEDLKAKPAEHIENKENNEELNYWGLLKCQAEIIVQPQKVSLADFSANSNKNMNNSESSEKDMIALNFESDPSTVVSNEPSKIPEDSVMHPEAKSGISLSYLNDFDNINSPEVTLNEELSDDMIEEMFENVFSDAFDKKIVEEQSCIDDTATQDGGINDVSMHHEVSIELDSASTPLHIENYRKIHHLERDESVEEYEQALEVVTPDPGHGFSHSSASLATVVRVDTPSSIQNRPSFDDDEADDEFVDAKENVSEGKCADTLQQQIHKHSKPSLNEPLQASNSAYHMILHAPVIIQTGTVIAQPSCVMGIESTHVAVDSVDKMSSEISKPSGIICAGRPDSYHPLQMKQKEGNLAPEDGSASSGGHITDPDMLASASASSTGSEMSWTSGGGPVARRDLLPLDEDQDEVHWRALLAVNPPDSDEERTGYESDEDFDTMDAEMRRLEEKLRRFQRELGESAEEEVKEPCQGKPSGGVLLLRSQDLEALRISPLPAVYPAVCTAKTKHLSLMSRLQVQEYEESCSGSDSDSDDPESSEDSSDFLFVKTKIKLKPGDRKCRSLDQKRPKNDNILNEECGKIKIEKDQSCICEENLNLSSLALPGETIDDDSLCSSYNVPDQIEIPPPPDFENAMYNECKSHMPTHLEELQGPLSLDCKNDQDLIHDADRDLLLGYIWHEDDGMASVDFEGVEDFYSYEGQGALLIMFEDDIDEDISYDDKGIAENESLHGDLCLTGTESEDLNSCRGSSKSERTFVSAFKNSLKKASKYLGPNIENPFKKVGSPIECRSPELPVSNNNNSTAIHEQQSSPYYPQVPSPLHDTGSAGVYNVQSGKVTPSQTFSPYCDTDGIGINSFSSGEYFASPALCVNTSDEDPTILPVPSAILPPAPPPRWVQWRPPAPKEILSCKNESCLQDVSWCTPPVSTTLPQAVQVHHELKSIPLPSPLPPPLPPPVVDYTQVIPSDGGDNEMQFYLVGVPKASPAEENDGEKAKPFVLDRYNTFTLNPRHSLIDSGANPNENILHQDFEYDPQMLSSLGQSNCTCSSHCPNQRLTECDNYVPSCHLHQVDNILPSQPTHKPTSVKQLKRKQQEKMLRNEAEEGVSTIGCTFCTGVPITRARPPENSAHWRQPSPHPKAITDRRSWPPRVSFHQPLIWWSLPTFPCQVPYCSKETSKLPVQQPYLKSPKTLLPVCDDHYHSQNGNNVNIPSNSVCLPSIIPASLQTQTVCDSRLSVYDETGCDRSTPHGSSDSTSSPISLSPSSFDSDPFWMPLVYHKLTPPMITVVPHVHGSPTTFIPNLTQDIDVPSGGNHISSTLCFSNSYVYPQINPEGHLTITSNTSALGRSSYDSNGESVATPLIRPMESPPRKTSSSNDVDGHLPFITSKFPVLINSDQSDITDENMSNKSLTVENYFNLPRSVSVSVLNCLNHNIPLTHLYAPGLTSYSCPLLIFTSILDLREDNTPININSVCGDDKASLENRIPSGSLLTSHAHSSLRLDGSSSSSDEWKKFTLKYSASESNLETDSG